MPCLERNLRCSMRCKVVWKWLRGRKDLAKYLNTLIDASYLGWLCSATTATALCHLGECEVMDTIEGIRTMNCCFECFLKRGSVWKIACRKFLDLRDRQGYAWWNHQYVEQLAARFDVEISERRTTDNSELITSRCARAESGSPSRQKRLRNC